MTWMKMKTVILEIQLENLVLPITRTTRQPQQHLRCVKLVGMMIQMLFVKTGLLPQTLCTEETIDSPAKRNVNSRKSSLPVAVEVEESKHLLETTKTANNNNLLV